ncbi:MAG: glycosyltransferase family 4 protein [Verrucomicrobia bacterium]|nr:glycosyltransferase family 4 protein [Verrucomicrobiota bacterium]
MLLDAWFPHFGGGIVHIWELSRRLVLSHGCEVDIVTRSLCDEQGAGRSDNETHLDGRLRVWRLGPPRRFEHVPSRLAFLARAAVWLARRRFDLIHTHSFLPAIPATMVRALRGTPVVCTVHITSLFKPKPAGFRARLDRWVEQWLLTRLRYDQVITVAGQFRSLLKRSPNVTVIANGVDLARFEPAKPWPPKFQMLFVGRFHPDKGLLHLIEAMAILQQRNLRVPVTLVGGGPQEAELRQLAQQRGLADLVTFAGQATGPMLSDAYGNCSLFVLPSLAEGQPLTLLEAWAARRPVLATLIADNASYVREGENGFLVPPGDPQALAAAIERAAARPDLARLGENGYRMVRERFTWDRVAEEAFAVYRKAVKT